MREKSAQWCACCEEQDRPVCGDKLFAAFPLELLEPGHQACGSLRADEAHDGETAQSPSQLASPITSVGGMLLYFGVNHLTGPCPGH
jgi:hypothetical protein